MIAATLGMAASSSVSAIGTGTSAAATRTTGVMTWGEIRTLGIEWYRKRGVSFDHLNRTFRAGDPK